MITQQQQSNTTTTTTTTTTPKRNNNHKFAIMIQPAVTIDPIYQRTIAAPISSAKTTSSLLTKSATVTTAGTTKMTTPTASWRWCSFLCNAAIKCFGNNNLPTTTTTNSSAVVRTGGVGGNSQPTAVINRNGCHLTIIPRRSYDGNLNVTYEL